MKEQMGEEALAAFYGVYDSWKTDFKTALKAIKVIFQCMAGLIIFITTKRKN